MEISSGIATCGSGAFWNVVGPDDVALGNCYGNKEEAEEMADELSSAYEKGRQGGREHVHAATAEIRAALEKMMLEMQGGEP